jgi:hypothetical protein
MTVVRATSAHYHHVAALMEKLFARAFSPYPLSQGLRAVASALVPNPLSAVFLAMDGPNAVGYVWVEALDNGYAWLHQVYSESKEATELLKKEVLEFARSRGCRKVGGITYHGEDFVRAVCRRHGFKVEGYLLSIDL